MNKIKIAVIGLGYVGLPLAIQLGKYFNVNAYDINKTRILDLNNKVDTTKEITRSEFFSAKKLKFTNDETQLKNSNIFIITVPTPLKNKNIPDLKFIYSALNVITNVLTKKSIIVLESTVYPGFCEEIVKKYFEKKTKYKFNKDFFLGYSPERINPGKSNKKLSNIVKIVSASNQYSLDILCKIYGKIIDAGIFRASSIKIAEAAKVIENVQRDVNIALVNEFAMIFKKMNINTQEVLKAAESKWNFLPFKPGFVGGHCIGVDPYYLTYKSKKIGINPKLILSGRNINNSIPSKVAKEIECKLNSKNETVKGLIMGLTFKENCNDTRNSGSYKIYKILKKKFKVDVYDPVAIKDDCLKLYKKDLVLKLNKNEYDFILIAVKHDNFKLLGIKKIRSFCTKKGFIYDLKNLFKNEQIDLTL